MPPCVANENAMRQILLNLITNAVQAMPDGGELVPAHRARRRRPRAARGAATPASASRRAPAGHLQPVLHHQGAGPGDRASGSRSCTRSCSATAATSGSTSEVGAGTTFTIELPCPCHDDARGRRRPDLIAMPARILLVEDEPNMARTLAKNLERAGLRRSSTRRTARRRSPASPSVAFDVVLTDLKMPVMDGMELLRAMHERGIAAAAVVLTGYGTIETAVEAMKLGAADYLIKDAPPAGDPAHARARPQGRRRSSARTRRLRREIGRLQRLRRADRPEPGDAGDLPADRRGQPEQAAPCC